MCVCVCVVVCLLVCSFVCLSVRPSVSLSVGPSVRPTVCLSVWLPVDLSVYLSVYLSVCLSISTVCLYVSTYIYPQIRMLSEPQCLRASMHTICEHATRIKDFSTLVMDRSIPWQHRTFPGLISPRGTAAASLVQFSRLQDSLMLIVLVYLQEVAEVALLYW